MSPRIRALALSTLLLAACGGGAGESDGGGSVEPDSRLLCITEDCGAKEVLAHIPEAENLVFTDDGRLFVTGSNLYEIIKQANGSFEAVPIAAEGSHSSSLGGLAIRDGMLYMNDELGSLWAARLAPTADMKLTKIHRYTGIAVANALDFGPDGALYSTFGPTPNFATLTSVVRLHLDPKDPFKVLEQEKVFGLAELFGGANGLVLQGKTFYIVGYLSSGLDVSSVLAFDVGTDGTVGELRRVAGGVGFYDDLEVIGDRIIVANNFLNSLLMFDKSGQLIANSGMIWDGPAALTWGRPPMFQPTDILVAERGLLGEGQSDNGNALSVFRRKQP